MWYQFELYEEQGDEVVPVDVVLIQARSIPQAWEKAGDFAYKYGYCDYNMVTDSGRSE